VKIKLDENIGARGSERLAERAHDVSTVRDHFRRQPPRLFHRFLAALLFTTVAEFL
jgi:hypothetical protein